MSSVSLDIQKPQAATPSGRYDVVVVGAGPYGLSTAAHLLGCGLKVATFGKPLHFWRVNMPEGMILRSFWWATNLSDPERKYSFSNYFQEKGIQGTDPLPAEIFIDYGLWFQKKAIPNLDETYVANVARYRDHFVVTLEDGRVVQANTVVMAPGLQYYKYVPSEYAHMPASLVSHTSQHRFMNGFVGKEVAIIGAGQAALETAALLNENGTRVHVLARHPVYWIQLSASTIPPLLRNLRAPKAGMGDGWLNVLMEQYPYIFQQLPIDTRDYLLATRHGPAGSYWLRPRVENKVSLLEGVQVKKIDQVGERARLTLSNGKVLDVDHVMLGTGYRTDISLLPMLDASLVREVRTYKGSPVLNTWFESSVPGLYFTGFSAARSFGFLYRFVIGADPAARRVANAIVNQPVQAR